MAEEPSVATLPVEGAGVESPPQQTPPVAQAPAEPENTGIPPKVEGDVNKTQTPEPQRPQYDGLFRQERKRIRRLEETIAQLNKKLEQPPAKVPTNEPLDHNLIFQKPDEYLTAREQRLRDEIAALRSEFTDQRNAQIASQKEQKGLEALEKLFPKSSPDAKETLEERVQKNPERAEALKEFFDDPEIKAIAEINPDKAVKLAIAELGLAAEPKPNPLVLKKGAMGGTGTGNPGMGTKTSVSESDLLAEKKNLDDQLDKNPSLRFDDNWKKKKADVMASILRLVTKK